MKRNSKSTLTFVLWRLQPLRFCFVQLLKRLKRFDVLDVEAFDGSVDVALLFGQVEPKVNIDAETCPGGSCFAHLALQWLILWNQNGLVLVACRHG